MLHPIIFYLWDCKAFCHEFTGEREKCPTSTRCAFCQRCSRIGDFYFYIFRNISVFMKIYGLQNSLLSGQSYFNISPRLLCELKSGTFLLQNGNGRGATKGRIPSNSKTKEIYFEHTLMVGRWLKGKNFFRDLLYFYLWSPSFSFQLGGGKLFVIFFLGLFLSLIFPSSS